jgi:hypothetical protein
MVISIDFHEDEGPEDDEWCSSKVLGDGEHARWNPYLGRE